MNRSKWAAAVASLITFNVAPSNIAQVLAAEDGTAIASRFGAQQDVLSAAMSPDGSKISFVAPHQGGTVVYVATLGSQEPPKIAMGMAAADGRLRYCVWSTAERLICLAHYVANDGVGLLSFTRWFATNADGTGLKQLSSSTNSNSHYRMQYGGSIMAFDMGGQSSTVVMARQFVPDTAIGSLTGSKREGLGVEAVDTVTLKRKIIVEPRLDAGEFIADGQGEVRVMGLTAQDLEGNIKPKVRYMYRKAGETAWLPLSEATMLPSGGTDGFVPYVVDSAKNLVYGVDEKAGFTALYSMNLDDNRQRTEIFARPDTDVDQLIRIGRNRRLVGVSFANERRTVEYFDPELKRLSAGLARALPGQPLVEIIDSSADESKLLIVASSDTDPGTLYRFDKATRQLERIMLVRSPLEGKTLAPMKPVTYKAADGTAIPAYLTLPIGSTGKGLPAIVMPHGGPSSRDEWGFNWLVQFFAARGYAVLQPNFRGSTGYGAEWYRKNGFQSWRDAIGDVNDAGRWLVAEGIAAPSKLGILGWSYGGYAALQSSVVDPDLFKAIVAIAPVTDLGMVKAEADRFTNSMLVAAFIGEGPHIREGSPAQNVDRFKAPVLLFHGDRDQNVGVRESRVMANRLKAAGRQVNYIEFQGLDHQLDDGAARSRLLTESDSFLRKAMGLEP